jgi:hypothetical protein
MLQEAGHALSIGNSSDPNSVMYESYQGPRSGLSAGDIASIQSLYGPRPADAFEGSTGNGTLASATRYAGALTADLTSAGDVDVYKFTGAFLASKATVTLHAEGLSLVAARVEVLDSNGTILASAAAADPTNNDITLTLNSVHSGAAYYVRVSSARSDVFGVGAYQLDIKQQTLLGGVLDTVGGLLDDTGINDTLSTAAQLLSNTNTVDSASEYGVDGSFGSPSDVDDYQIVVPASPGGSPVNLVTTVWGHDGAILSPWIAVFDGVGNKLNAEVLTADGNTTTIQVRGLVPGNAYVLSLSSELHAVGDYHLAADLRIDPVSLPHGGSGTLSADAPVAAATFSLAQTDQIHFVLAATGASNNAEATLVVTASDGTVVAQLNVPVGRGRSIDLFLPAGDYRVEIRGNDPFSPLAFQLGMAVETDPTGATPTDPTSTPEQPPSPPPPPPSEPVMQPADPNSDDTIWY